MVSLTLAVPKELKSLMEKHPEINWSEVARQSIWEKSKILEKMDKLLSKSKFTKEDALKHGKIVKEKVWRLHKEAE